MAVNYVTTIQPLGIDMYVEDSVAGTPTFNTARSGSLCIVAVGGAINWYILTSFGIWSLLLRNPVDLAAVISDAGDNLITGGLWLRAPFPAGLGPTDIALPARTGGWRVVDSYMISGGAGGDLQVQTTAAAAISDAMVPGAQFAITRAASNNQTNGAIASAGSVRLAGHAALLAGTAFLRIEPR